MSYALRYVGFALLTAVALLVHQTHAQSNTSYTAAQASKLVEQFVQAIKVGDVDSAVKLTAAYSATLKEMQRNQPQVMWGKLASQVVAEQKASFAKKLRRDYLWPELEKATGGLSIVPTNERYWMLTFPDLRYKIEEVRAGGRSPLTGRSSGYEVYVTVRYGSPTSCARAIVGSVARLSPNLEDYRSVKSVIMQFSVASEVVRHGLQDIVPVTQIVPLSVVAGGVVGGSIELWEGPSGPNCAEELAELKRKKAEKEKAELERAKAELMRGFWSAVLGGEDAKVEELLNKGADPNERSESGSTALCMTLRLGTVRLLLGHGANVNLTCGDGTPLSEAVSNCTYLVVQELLVRGADPNFKAPQTARRPGETLVDTALRRKKELAGTIIDPAQRDRTLTACQRVADLLRVAGAPASESQPSAAGLPASGATPTLGTLAGEWEGKINDPQGGGNVKLSLSGGGSAYTGEVLLTAGKKSKSGKVKLLLEGNSVRGAITYSSRLVFMPCNFTININGEIREGRLRGTTRETADCTRASQDGTIEITKTSSK